MPTLADPKTILPVQTVDIGSGSTRDSRTVPLVLKARSMELPRVMRLHGLVPIVNQTIESETGHDASAVTRGFEFVSLDYDSLLAPVREAEELASDTTVTIENIVWSPSSDTVSFHLEGLVNATTPATLDVRRYFLNSTVSELLGNAKHEDLEFGADSLLSRELTSLLSRYGGVAFEAVSSFLRTQPIEIDTLGDVLRTLGRLQSSLLSRFGEICSYISSNRRRYAPDLSRLARWQNSTTQPSFRSCVQRSQTKGPSG